MIHKPRRIGVMVMRQLTRQELRDLKEPLIIQILNERPLAVIVPYGLFMKVQECWKESQRVAAAVMGR